MRIYMEIKPKMFLDIFYVLIIFNPALLMWGANAPQRINFLNPDFIKFFTFFFSAYVFLKPAMLYQNILFSPFFVPQKRNKILLFHPPPIIGVHLHPTSAVRDMFF